MSKERPERKRDRTVTTTRRVGSREFERRRRASRTRDTRKRGSRARPRMPRRIPLRDLLRRVPIAAWICVAVAILNAICWSIIVPAFEVPDEPNHFAYVKQIAETGTLPTSAAEAYETNAEMIKVLDRLHYPYVRQQPGHRTISTAHGQERLEQGLAQLRAEPGAKGSFAAGVAASQPPLYYALEAVPYNLAGNALTRLQLMRLLSALMAGLTTLFVFLFLRETLPVTPWAWSVGGLATAVMPLLGFVSGAVNPDAMLFAVSAALFYVLARAFRRGLTRRVAVAFGIVVAIGMLTKLNFAGLLPGACIGVFLLTMRARRSLGRSAWRSLGIALGIPAVLLLLYAIVNVASNHSPFGLISRAFNGEGISLPELSYVWQLFLPRLPGMVNDFPGIFTPRTLWFNGYVGLYGWLDTAFPGWVYEFALIPLAAVVALFLRDAVRIREALLSRRAELVTYAAMAAGLMVMIGYASYAEFPAVDATFAESRYLLPLVPLFATGVAMAARGAGRRWGPAIGTVIVFLFLAHDVFSQLLVLTRYYA